MIVSFGDQGTSDLYHGVQTRRARAFPRDIVSVALRKLDMLDSAGSLLDLRTPPGNRLEALRGYWQGFYSIRVNDQWRVVFRWAEDAAHDVRILDYHRG